MAGSLVLTIIGDDRPGLVETLSSLVAAHDGNWLESRMSRLAGKFAGIVRVEAPDTTIASLTSALAALESQGLRVVAERSAVATETAFTPLTLDLVGADHPGIIHDIARVLAGRGVNVEELTTECTDAPMSGQALFKATARLRLPAGVEADDVRRELEDLAVSLMIDLSLIHI